MTTHTKVHTKSNIVKHSIACYVQLMLGVAYTSISKATLLKLYN